MNEKEIGELRRHLRRDRCNMTAVYGCYVNQKKEIISEFRQSLGTIPEDEAEKYFTLFKRTLSGTLGKNLVDICFATRQVGVSPEHKLLTDLRKTKLEDAALRRMFYQKVIESAGSEESYLILLGCDSYDVPFKGRDGATRTDKSDETFTYLVCSICPVKLSKPALQYDAGEKTFRESSVQQTVCPPQLGFLFPAFDDRTTNLYNALFYTKDIKLAHDAFIQKVFNTTVPKPAYEQKKTFEALLSTALDDECGMEVIQEVHNQLCQRIELHKESRSDETLLIGKEDVCEALGQCGVSEAHQAKFSVDYDEAFGFEMQLPPGNLIDSKHFEVRTPDVSVRVSPEHRDLVETRIIGGAKYILIRAEEDIEVNGVNIRIQDKKPGPGTI